MFDEEESQEEIRQSDARRRQERYGKTAHDQICPEEEVNQAASLRAGSHPKSFKEFSGIAILGRRFLTTFKCQRKSRARHCRRSKTGL